MKATISEGLRYKSKIKTDTKQTLCVLILSTTATSCPLIQWDASVLSASSSQQLSSNKPLFSDLATGSTSLSSLCRAAASLCSLTSRSFNHRSSFSRFSVDVLSQFFAIDWAIVDARLNCASAPSASPSDFYNISHPIIGYISHNTSNLPQQFHYNISFVKYNIYLPLKFQHQIFSNSKWNSFIKQPFVDYCWRLGFDWSLLRNGLSNRHLPLSFGAVRSETEQRTAIRQTVPKKAPVEAETSTIINKRLFYEWISFWISLLFNLWVYSKTTMSDLFFWWFNCKQIKLS